MAYPSFNSGDVLNASDMNAVGLWRITNCTVTSVGGTSATASNGVITVGTSNTSVTVNNAFSSDFLHYRIMYQGGTSTASNDLALTVGNANTAYYFSSIYTDYTVGGAVLKVAINNGVSWTYAGAQESPNRLVCDIMNPYASAITTIATQYVGPQAGRVIATGGGFLNNTTSYTSFTITVGAGSISGGTIRVYGYRD